jgi:hypothetical protein
VNHYEDDTMKFVGIEKLNQKHSEQLELFRTWADNNDWSSFHHNHYDWWAFPYDQPSALGFAYVVHETEVQQLLALPGFRDRHAEAARLLLRSWGWDANTNAPITNPTPDQQWQNHPIRHFKCTRSMQQFHQDQLAESCLAYARTLVEQTKSFDWHGRDLAQELGLR